MSYYVIEKPCPDCDGEGFSTFKTLDRELFPVMLEVNCGRCFTTGWIELYGWWDDGTGSDVAVEVPNPPNPPRTGAGQQRLPVPVG